MGADYHPGQKPSAEVQMCVRALLEWVGPWASLRREALELGLEM